MVDVLVVVVSSCTLFPVRASATTVMSSRAHDVPRPMWKILQIDAERSRLRTKCTTGWFSDTLHVVMMTNLGQGPVCFFSSLPGKSHECVDRR